MSNAKPMAAIAQITHCVGVRGTMASPNHEFPGRRLYSMARETDRVHRFLLFLAYLVLVTVSAPPASAQGTTSPISGTVSDPSGGALPGATVSARSLETGAVRTVVSDEHGRFVVTGLPVGAYELRVELTGFRPTESRVDLVVGSQAVVPIVLRVGGITEEVSVSGGAAAVNV